MIGFVWSLSEEWTSILDGTEFESTKFALIIPHHTIALKIFCSIKLHTHSLSQIKSRSNEAIKGLWVCLSNHLESCLDSVSSSEVIHFS